MKIQEKHATVKQHCLCCSYFSNIMCSKRNI